MDFTKRTFRSELMDDPHLPERELKAALKDISMVNRFLGGNRISLKAIEGIIKENPDRNQFSIIDVGCGDGEMLRLIGNHFKNSKLTLELTGIDLNDNSVQMGRKKCNTIDYRIQDIMQLPDKSLYDIVLCTLTIHHLKTPQLKPFIKKLHAISGIAVIVNDLHRHPFAYHLFRIFSTIFIKSPVARHDGRISILNGFKKKELRALSDSLGITNDTIARKWAFRLLWKIPAHK